MSGASSVYEFQPGLILGFHGCDREVGLAVLNGREQHLKPSEKEFDWLGSGVYFWEGDPTRALEWAQAKASRGNLRTPFVLGAVIDLRHCLDLFDRAAIEEVRQAHGTLKEGLRAYGSPMPKNTGKAPDWSGRMLDCAVINFLHLSRARRAVTQPGWEEYDSVRGPFLEGSPIYPGAGFRSHTHIQICVRNPMCIKGYFRPLALA